MANKKRRAPQGAVKKPPPKNREATKARLTKHQQDRRRARQRNNILLGLAALSIIGALLYFTLGSYLRERSAIADMTDASCRFDERTDPGASGQHVPSPTFSVEPPSGGLHTPEVAGAGDYSAAPQLPGDGQLVHALEHGYINIWYKPDLPQADIDALKAFQQANRADTLLIPRATLSTPVAVTAWHKRLLCDKVEVPALERFASAYLNKGPERVPHPG